ncbi:hypothetical protein ABH930_004282 [Kitasatospora sp. GAS204A]|nr:hypothetical protein [Kitasatospora sp. GAS204B]
MKVRDRSPRGLGWWARAWLSATVAWVVVALLAVLPLGAGTVQQAHADSGSRTVQGPPVWIPSGTTGAGTTGPNGSVTVTPTTGLTDQVVHVSWTGFTPSVNQSGGGPATYAVPKNTKVDYAVRVYECRGTDPRITDCYGSSLYGADGSKGFLQKEPAPGTTTPDLPSNAALAVTGPDGSGSADIETWTADQSPSLGCDATHACSIVVEPNYGGDSLGLTAFLKHQPPGTTHCEVHTYDRGVRFTAEDQVTVQQSFGSPSYASGEACAWANKTVVPLTFAPTAASCAAGNSAFSMAGLPMAERALQQWRAGACLATSPLYAAYTSQGEPQARQSFLGGSGAEVALTSVPDTGAAARPYVYVPLVNSAISVVFEVDDPVTGRQIRQLRLNARLLAKELTQSYSQGPDAFAAATVKGNPECLFQDPEFLALNPASLIAPAQWPACDTVPQSLPIVVGNSSDMVRRLTSWIIADPQAAAFLQGAPDNWGMHVDPDYLRPSFSGYPTDILVPQDSSGFVAIDGTDYHEKQYEWAPVISGLTDTVRHVLAATPTCELVDHTGLYPRCPAENVGQRQLIGIVDSADAQAMSLPEAQLLNQQGSFVAPTLASMQAAVSDMPVDPKTYTQQLPYGASGTSYANDPNAYPLTMVQYAMAPTANLGDAKTTAVSQFLQQVTDFGGGQLYGREPGKLGPGYADLTPAQAGFAQDAIAHVAAQDGTLPGNQVAPATPPPTTTPGTPPATQPAAQTTAQPVAQDNSGTNSNSGVSGKSGSGITGAGDNSGAGNPPAPGAASAGSPAPSASASAAAPGSGLAPVAAGTPSPDRAGVARLLLPVVLIVGAVLLVGGPAALLVSGTAAGARLLTRLRRGAGAGGRTG